MEEDEKERQKLVDNEQTKLSAVYTNGVAIAVFAVGGFGPLHGTVLANGKRLLSGSDQFLRGLSGGKHRATLLRTPCSSEARPMTLLQFSSLLVMPLGGLVIGAIVLWVNSRDSIKVDPMRR